MVNAQNFDPVTFGWGSSRPLAYEDENGDLIGLHVELARELGREVGFETEFLRVENLGEWVETLSNGQTQIIPGVPKLPAFNENVVFSRAAFFHEVRLMVRVEDANRVTLANLEGKRVGVIPPAFGSDPALMPGAIIRPYPNPKAALIDLISGYIDAISAPTYFTLPAARAARVDNRVTFTADHLLDYELFIGINKTREELLGPVNDALDAMEQDGRLEYLARKYAVLVPEDAPEVLTVGVYHFPPYQAVNPDGSFSGFAVEVMRDLADRAGLKVSFTEISLQEWQAGPSAETYDMLPQAGINADRQARMDFSYPIEQAQISIFVPAGKEDGISSIDDLAGLRVGTSATNLVRRLVEGNENLTPILLKDQNDHLSSLLDGRADAILYPPQAIRELAAAQEISDQIVEIQPPVHVSQRAPALRPGLGEVRERLNTVIPGYLISDEFRVVRNAWFGEPVFWSQKRIYVALSTAGLAIFGLGTFLIIQRQRQQAKMLDFQRRELAYEAQYNQELENVVQQLERSNENLNDFAYIASHDLKEPLRGIAINADFLSREGVTEASKKRIDRMVNLTTRMEQLISDLLYFSRLGRDEENRQHVDLIKLLGHLRADLKETLEESGSTFTIATDMPKISAESARVRTVFYNLIMNGLIYNDSDEKTIEIGFSKSEQVNGQTLNDVFYVKDNGIGIDEKNREKVFRIFTRLNKESDYGRGTGAGLSFVKKVLEIYDCKLTFASELGVGTTFYFTLPLADTKPLKKKAQERTVT